MMMINLRVRKGFAMLDTNVRNLPLKLRVLPSYWLVKSLKFIQVAILWMGMTTIIVLLVSASLVYHHCLKASTNPDPCLFWVTFSSGTISQF
jgi:hypothetical protein